MRCTIFALGTRGDVEPLIALGTGLRAAGVRVRVAAQRDFAATVERHGLDYAPVSGHSSSFFRGPAGNALRERMQSDAEFQRFFDNYLAVGFTRILNDFWEASRDADVVLAWMNAGAPIAERLGVPVFVCGICPVPHQPTGAFANPYLGAPPERPGWLANRRSWRVNEDAARVGETTMNRWRTRTLGLPAIGWREDWARMRRLPHLLGYSPVLLPRPRDWKPWVHVTGFWFLRDPEPYRPPDDLQAFLDAGPPPIGVGFSSLVGRNPADATQVVINSVTQAGQRAVLLTGLGGLRGVTCPPHVFPMAAVPHAWLFPRLRAMVHHGGAGTTGMALQSGLPQMGVPFGYDQMLWAGQVHQLGLGPAPIPAESMTVERLVPALRALAADTRMRERAAEVSAAIRAEDGIGSAVSIILDTVDRRAARVSS